MEKANLIIVELDDPTRCQHTGRVGQCRNQAAPRDPTDPSQGFGRFCPVHAGFSDQRKAQQAAARMYKLELWQARMGQFADHDAIKSLREEIGILRLLMEERFKLCQTTTDLMLHSPVIADLVMKIEKVVASCNTLEGKMGMHLEKAELMQFAARVVEIVGSYVDDPKIIDNIANALLSTLSEEVS